MYMLLVLILSCIYAISIIITYIINNIHNASIGNNIYNDSINTNNIYTMIVLILITYTQ